MGKSKQPKAIVVGAGIGGLAVSIRLQLLGYEVVVFESSDQPGGKMGVKRLGDYRFDTGPSLFTMPHFVTELFQLAGEEISQFQYSRKDIVCNYFWEDGKRFSAPADIQKFSEKAAENFDVSQSTVLSYLDLAKQKYNLTAPIFLERSLHKLKTYQHSNVMKSILSIGSLGINSTLDRVNRKAFKDKNLIQFFNRYATYNGSSPYQTPGIMSMIPHLEMYEGTFFPKGGMHAIAQSLYKLALKKGVSFRFSEPVKRISYIDDQVNGVETSEGFESSDIVVSNADVVPTYRKLLPDIAEPKRVLNSERSSSALIFYWGVNKEYPELDLHNILFSDDYKEEFKSLFEKKEMYSDPTIYINITSKEEKTDAPNGCENWFVMVNAPTNIGQNWDQIKTEVRINVIAKISRVLKTDIASHIDVEDVLDPVKIETQTGSYQGSLYGAASNSKFSAFLRHPNFSSRLKNLYFCGGSAHPGGGIPLCLLSAKIVAENVPHP
ncbi:1-hydroxycarotenoid 3,4-desaturase CrtD [Reichenbachiella versicolor]|uniref:1-hydroxycarotenoid 3,4-desaturase CrtD n=1 Tax=Reichenbachiella versicolor TaxID=1821036 RepID=UPI000D6EA36D|nr:1-hydroxycarotenoid 3,4-desaturase CrtD [Reichenbachiella versicolor]